MKKVLIDTSSAILLFKSSLFDHLVDMYDVLITQSVYDELTKDNYPGSEAFKNYCLDNKMIIQPPSEKEMAYLHPLKDTFSLDRGERETIYQYMRGIGNFIIIDDGRGARYCKDNSIPYINALLFPRILYLSRYISETDYCDKIKTLIGIGRYSRKVIDYALNCSKGELRFFLP
jgi:hypothetical protein